MTRFVDLVSFGLYFARENLSDLVFFYIVVGRYLRINRVFSYFLLFIDQFGTNRLDYADSLPIQTINIAQKE